MWILLDTELCWGRSRRSLLDTRPDASTQTITSLTWKLDKYIKTVPCIMFVKYHAIYQTALRSGFHCLLSVKKTKTIHLSRWWTTQPKSRPPRFIHDTPWKPQKHYLMGDSIFFKYCILLSLMATQMFLSSPCPVFSIQNMYSQICYFLPSGASQSCVRMQIKHVRKTEERRNVAKSY